MMGNDLKNLKDRRYTLATARYENFKSSNKRDHSVMHLGLADPWKDWESTNRLDSSWYIIPRILKSKGKPFEVEEKQVDSGTGKVQIKWFVWDASEKLANLQVELYSVMRAEHYYIKKQYRKLASKYFWWLEKKSKKGKKYKIPIENCGVDNFFKKGEGEEYIICESKFTRDEGLFAKWKEDKENVWKLMGRYSASGKPCRQMSWDWLADRAKKAVKKPAGIRKIKTASGTRRPTPEEKAAIRAEVREMAYAIDEIEGVSRVVNIFGAQEVPIYPGRYKFKSAEKAKISKNELHLMWSMDIKQDEFIKLDDKFDDWAEKNP